MPIFIKEIKSYTKVMQFHSDRFNLGIIEHNGCLNIKPELREMLVAENVNVSGHQDWHPSLTGACHNGRGTGYAGYIIFNNRDAAIEYLGQYLDVQIDN